MLAGVLQGETLAKQDFQGVNEFICTVEDIFTLAIETGRQNDFDCRSIYHSILNSKLPFLCEKWSNLIGKSGGEEKTFPQFLTFLTEFRESASEFHDMDDGFTLVQSKRATTAKVSAIHSDMEKSDATGQSTTPEPKQKSESQRLQCPICRQEHFLDACPRFGRLKPAEKLTMLRVFNRCFRCTATHQGKECRYRPTCAECGLQHPTAMHGVRLLPPPAARNAANVAPLIPDLPLPDPVESGGNEQA